VLPMSANDRNGQALARHNRRHPLEKGLRPGRQCPSKQMMNLRALANKRRRRRASRDRAKSKRPIRSATRRLSVLDLLFTAIAASCSRVVVSERTCSFLPSHHSGFDGFSPRARRGGRNMKKPERGYHSGSAIWTGWPSAVAYFFSSSVETPRSY
jgi:hypothetical protein